MSFDLKPEIKKILSTIDFVKRYEHMSENSRAIAGEAVFSPSVEETIQIINGLGYEAVYDKKERFYKVGIIENLPTYRIWLNIILRSKVAEFVWVVYHNDEIRLGSPWGVYPRLLISPDCIIKPPLYSTRSDFEQLMKAAFELYEEFKQAVIEEYQSCVPAL
jgi:hypothetical protein